MVDWATEYPRGRAGAWDGSGRPGSRLTLCGLSALSWMRRCSLHDALPVLLRRRQSPGRGLCRPAARPRDRRDRRRDAHRLAGWSGLARPAGLHLPPCAGRHRAARRPGADASRRTRPCWRSRPAVPSRWRCWNPRMRLAHDGRPVEVAHLSPTTSNVTKIYIFEFTAGRLLGETPARAFLAHHRALQRPRPGGRCGVRLR